MSLIIKVPFLRAFTVWFLRPPALETRSVFGLEFNNPVGIAAGFDKNAEHIDLLADLGFGFIEIGSVTAEPAGGNAQPRLFRLPLDDALINRMGLNNHGVSETAKRLTTCARRVPIFVNVAKSPNPKIEGQFAIADYLRTIKVVKNACDVVVINISCPNSGDGRTFEDPLALKPLLKAVQQELGDKKRPWLVKISPDLEEGIIRQIIEISVECGVHGFTATNTTLNRTGLLTTSDTLNEIGAGGLSGAPLHPRALTTVRTIRSMTELPIIGVGGIRSAAHAQAFFDAGASLVQLYTGFVYGGPATVKKICAGLKH